MSFRFIAQSIDTMAFRYVAEARVYKYLGEYDALVELEEVAIRRFVEAVDESPEPREFVISEARRFGINVTVVPGEVFRLNAARTNIVVAYQSVDQFLQEFKDEHELLHQRAWPPRHDREAAMEHLTRSVGDSVAEVERAIGKLRLEIFNYYRLARNLATHRHDPGSDNWQLSDQVTGPARRKLDARLKHIHERFSEEMPDFRGNLAAPNSYDHFTFDDFVLATRNIKHIASALSKLGQPSDEQLLLVLESAAIRFYRKEPHNLKRVRRRIAGEARSRFGIDQAHGDRIGSLWVEPAAR